MLFSSKSQADATFLTLIICDRVLNMINSNERRIEMMNRGSKENIQRKNISVAKIFLHTLRNESKSIC